MPNLHYYICECDKWISKKIFKPLRRPFISEQRFEFEEEIEKYGITRKKHSAEIITTLFILSVCSLIIYLVVENCAFLKVPWSQALTFILSLGIAIIVYKQWHAIRHEISVDKYYDRLDSVNKRLEALKGSNQFDMHIFAELDKLEYVIVKYELGYISPALVLRAITNFKKLCSSRAGFHERASHWVETATYLEMTKKLVGTVCADCDPVDDKKYGKALQSN